MRKRLPGGPHKWQTGRSNLTVRYATPRVKEGKGASIKGLKFARDRNLNTTRDILDICVYAADDKSERPKNVTGRAVKPR